MRRRRLTRDDFAFTMTVVVVAVMVALTFLTWPWVLYNMFKGL